MKITIVMGFFLPMPPAAGGATEKSWHRLAIAFAQRGHEVTVISRRWPDWPDDEVVEGVRYHRLPGFDHTKSLRTNLWRDFRWSRRVSRALPSADVTIVNCIALPVWLSRRRGQNGKLVVMTGRMPKGQYRLYGSIDRVLTVSSVVQTAVHAENRRFAGHTRVCGYPIDWQHLSAPARRLPANPTVIGYIGRIHREKGLDLLTDALALLARRADLPPWRVVLCGPQSIEQGGSGEAYAHELSAKLANTLPAGTWEMRAPLFDSNQLVQLYRQIDIFCYPSLAERGETFGVAVAEAMAAGAVPVISQLQCFRDFVTSGSNGLSFDHHAPSAAEHCADALSRLIADSDLRHKMATTAQASVQRYDFSTFADQLLADFSALK